MAEETLVQKLKRRQAQLEEIRQPWEHDWKRIAEYIIPRLEFMDEAEITEGGRIGTKRYDGSTQNALEIFASGLQGYSASPSMEWFKLRMRNRMIEKLPGVKEWLEECDEGMYSAFAISNFYEELYKSFRGIGSIGTVSLYTEEDLNEGKIVFSDIHPIECYIAENRYGKVDTLHRKFKLSARNAIEKFDENKLSEKIKKDAEKSPDTKYEFIHAVFPNNRKVFGKLNSQNKRYYSCYFESDGKETVKDGGYDQFPYSVWRWGKNSNELFGRSCAHNALIEVLTLNEVKKDLLLAAQREVDPPMMAPLTHRGRLRITPGGINYYENLDDERIIPVYERGTNFPIALEREQDIREIIRKHFYVDFFLMLASADVQMTATEIIERQQEKSVMLSPYISIMNTEFFDSIIDRVFQIEYNAGRLPEIPPVLYEFVGQEIEIEYMGPLAQAQKRLFETSGIVRSLQVSAPVMEMFPETKDKIDADKLIAVLLESQGMPAKVLRSDEEVEVLREMRAKAIEQQRALEAGKMVAETVPKINEPVQEGSILEQITTGASR